MPTTRSFSASKYGQQLYNVAGARQLTVSTLGESHGLDYTLGAAINYSCWRYYNADILYDRRSYANGGNVLAVGGTTTTGTNGLSTQVGWFASRPTDIAFIASGYNDAPNSLSTLNTLVSNVITSANSLFASGAKFVVIVGMTPSSTNAAAWQGYNVLMRKWVSQTNGAFFLDVSSVISDLTKTGSTGVAYRNIVSNPQGTYQSYTADGTHWSYYASRQIAPLVANIFKQIAPIRTPRQVFNAGNYDPVNAPYTNMLGDAGNCIGTAGLRASGFDTGVAGVDANSRLDLEISGGGIVVTPSIVTGSNGERKQRITVSGTTAGDYVQLSCTPTITNPNNSIGTRMLNMEAMIDLNSVVGLCDIFLRPTSSTYDSPQANSGNNAHCGRWTDGTSESLFAYSTMNVPVPSTNNPQFSIFLMFSPMTVSGSIDVSRISAALSAE